MGDSGLRVVAEQTEHGVAAGIESEGRRSYWHAATKAEALHRAVLDRADGQRNLARSAYEEAEALAALALALVAELGLPLPPSVTAPEVMSSWGATELEGLRRERDEARGILSDLDRCEHGRHEGDECYGCGGPSKGNPVVREWNTEHGTDRIVGYGIAGDNRPIRLPRRGEKWSGGR